MRMSVEDMHQESAGNVQTTVEETQNIDVS